MFVGREKELKEIKKTLKSKEKSAVLVYGKRRVGKSFLINHILNDFSGHKIYYECLDASFEENLNNFEQRIKEEFDNRFVHFSSFQEAFDYLSTINKNVVVVLDEYSYLKGLKEKGYVDSVFQNVIDNMGNNTHLVLLGDRKSVV